MKKHGEENTPIMADGYPMFEWAPGIPIIDELDSAPAGEQDTNIEADNNENNNSMEAENLQHEKDENIEDNVLQQ